MTTVQDREIRSRLIGLGRLSRVVRVLTVAVYSAVVCWIVCCIGSAYWGWPYDVGDSEQIGIFIAAAFIALLVLHYLQLYGLTTLKERETEIMRKALRSRFPDAVYSANGSIPRTTLGKSSFFELPAAEDDAVAFTAYGSIAFRVGERSATIYDIGVTTGGFTDVWSRVPVAGTLLMIYRTIIRPMFGVPVESSRHSFRVMFGIHTGAAECSGTIVVLPDNPDSKTSGLAESAKVCVIRNGARPVTIDDAEFGNLFAVYADDEIEARKILSPAVVQRIKALRSSFGRDLLVSFSEDRVCYAVPFEGGFLRPSRKSLEDERLFEQIFREIESGRRFIL